MPAKHFWIFFLASFFLAFNSSAQEKLPDYDQDHFSSFPSYFEVLNYAAKANSAILSAPEHQYKFEKRYTGWYLSEYEGWLDIIESSSELLWSAETRSFADQSIVDKASPSNVDRFLERKINQYKSKYFDHCPVYEYPGYNEDLILLLEDEKDLTAGCMDCYARALSEKATNMLHPYQLSASASYNKYDSTLVESDLPEDLVFSYMEAADNALEAFRRLVEKYPDYETIVGSIKHKYHNEIIAVFYNLSFSGRRDMASKYLPDGLFDEPILDFSRNTLMSCPPNAILFTWGDSDTYPLVYLQENAGYRTDVTIVNNNLINIGKYINYITTLLGEERNIDLTLPIDRYKLDNNNVLRVDPGMNNPSSTITDYFEALRDHPSRFIMTNDDQRWTTIPFKTFSIPIEDIRGNESPKINGSIRQSFLMKNHLFTLDLLVTNKGKRPICYTLSFRGSKDLGFDRYRKIEGFTMRLTANQKALKLVPMDLDKVLLNTYTFPRISKKLASRGEYRFYSGNGLYLFYLLLNGYLQEEKYDDFFRVYDAMNLNMPHEIYPYERFHLIFSQLLLDAGDKSKARAHLDALTNDFIEKFEFYGTIKYSELVTRQKEVSKQIETMKELLRFSGDFFDMAVFEEIESKLRPVLIEWENK
ncbi:MAG: hypothetical protein AAF502_00080 [Bacteroidota bacterium]